MLVLKPTTRLALEENIILQGISELDHYYAFDIKSGDQFRLNHTACWVLEAIGRGISFQQLVENYGENFNLQAGTAQDDLTEIIQNASENHIIKEVVI